MATSKPTKTPPVKGKRKGKGKPVTEEEVKPMPVVLEEPHPLKKVYPRISDVEISLLEMYPNNIYPGMFNSAEEYQAAVEAQPKPVAAKSPDVHALRKMYPNISDKEIQLLTDNPEGIYPGMFNSSEEFQAARSLAHQMNHVNHNKTIGRENR